MSGTWFWTYHRSSCPVWKSHKFCQSHGWSERIPGDWTCGKWSCGRLDSLLLQGTTEIGNGPKCSWEHGWFRWLRRWDWPGTMYMPGTSPRTGRLTSGSWCNDGSGILLTLWVGHWLFTRLSVSIVNFYEMCEFSLSSMCARWPRWGLEFWAGLYQLWGWSYGGNLGFWKILLGPLGLIDCLNVAKYL